VGHLQEQHRVIRDFSSINRRLHSTPRKAYKGVGGGNKVIEDNMPTHKVDIVWGLLG
jgi:hypothetical protein